MQWVYSYNRRAHTWQTNKADDLNFTAQSEERVCEKIVKWTTRKMNYYKLSSYRHNAGPSCLSLPPYPPRHSQTISSVFLIFTFKHLASIIDFHFTGFSLRLLSCHSLLSRSSHLHAVANPTQTGL